MSLRLRKKLRSGLWMMLLLWLLGPAVVLACKPAPPKSWKVTSPNGRYALSLEVGPRDSFPLTLRDVRTRKVVWKQTRKGFLSDGEVLLTASGLVVLAGTGSTVVVALGRKGTEVRRWNLQALLTPEEVQNIPLTSCGPMVLGSRTLEGDVLTLQLLTGGMSRPTHAQPRGTRIRIDTRGGKATRE